MFKYLTYIFIIFFVFTTNVVADDKIKTAIEFLKTACITGGEEVEIEIKGGANLTLTLYQLIKGVQTGIYGEVSFTKKELEGFVSDINEFSSQQVTEARECMKPYISRILDVILKEPGKQPSYLDEHPYLKGVWSFKVKWNDGTYRTLILQCYEGHDGKIEFKFENQYYSFKPVFDDISINDNWIILRFKLVLYQDESHVSGYRLNYLLKYRNGSLYGQSLPSWDNPQNIVLHKMR